MKLHLARALRHVDPKVDRRNALLAPAVPEPESGSQTRQHGDLDAKTLPLVGEEVASIARTGEQNSSPMCTCVHNGHEEHVQTDRMCALSMACKTKA